MPIPSILRSLDPGEAFFYMADKLSCMNFVVFAERDGYLLPEQIRAALDLVQREQALLRVQIVWNEGDGMCFADGSGAGISLSCREFAGDQWREHIEAELSHPFEDGTSPLMRCIYLSATDVKHSVLALCFHHSIADGRSGVELLRRMLESIAGCDTKTTMATSLPTPMYQAFPPHRRWSDNADAADALADTMMADYKRFGRLVSQPWLSSSAAERQPHFMRVELDGEATLRLTSRCRAEDTSVHGALCAAQLMAQNRLNRAEGPATQFLACPVDMRPHLVPPPPAIQLGFNVSIVSSPFVVHEDTHLWSLSRDIMAHTRRQMDRGEGHLFFSMYGLEESPIAPDRLNGFTKAVLSSWQNTMVSNVGRIAPVTADPAVTRISFALCPMPYQTLFTAASAYNDRLILNVGYDAARLPAALAQEIAGTMYRLLSQ